MQKINHNTRKYIHTNIITDTADIFEIVAPLYIKNIQELLMGTLFGGARKPFEVKIVTIKNNVNLIARCIVAVAGTAKIDGSHHCAKGLAA